MISLNSKILVTSEPTVSKGDYIRVLNRLSGNVAMVCNKPAAGEVTNISSINMDIRLHDEDVISMPMPLRADYMIDIVKKKG